MRLSARARGFESHRLRFSYKSGNLANMLISTFYISFYCLFTGILINYSSGVVITVAVSPYTEGLTPLIR